jgi:putative tryptophan/tyrosine transport system substrate-binding protein
VRRREFITRLAGAVVMWPLAARAQQDQRIRRVGVLMFLPESDPESQVRLAAFRQGLEGLGWTVGRNLAIDYRWNTYDIDRGRAGAAELLALSPDVILAISTPALQGILSVSRTVPVVFTNISEPVAQGFAESLSRPGGIVTGFSHLAPTVGGKWMDLLKESAPHVSRVAFIFNPPSSAYGGLFFGSIQLAATRHSVQAKLLPVYEPAEIDEVLTTFGREPDGGLIIGGENFTLIHHRLIFELATRYRLPTIGSGRPMAMAGSLLCYGLDNVHHVRQAATYIDRILRGEKPAELPVQQPTKFELVINMKTAKALGFTIPETLLATADEVIQ